MATVDPRDNSIVDLMSRLRADVTALLRSEVALAKRETRDQIDLVQRRAAAAALAGAVAHAGVILVLAGLAALLSYMMPIWIALLLVGLGACAASAVVGYHQQQALAEMDPAPKRAVERTKTDYQAIEEATQ